MKLTDGAPPLGPMERMANAQREANRARRPAVPVCICCGEREAQWSTMTAKHCQECNALAVRDPHMSDAWPLLFAESMARLAASQRTQMTPEPGPTRAEFLTAIESMRASIRELEAAVERAIVQRDAKPAKVVVGYRVKVRVNGPQSKWWVYERADGLWTHKRPADDLDRPALIPTRDVADMRAASWRAHGWLAKVVPVTRRVKL